jgi:serine acetyltransferase
MQLHERGWRRSAYALKTFNYLVFKCVLPPECRAAEPVQLLHRGLAVVVAPNTHFGRGVTMAHSVTIAAGHQDFLPKYRITVGDDVSIGTGVVVIAKRNQPLTLGDRCTLAAGAVVTSDVEPDTIMVGPLATPLEEGRRSP